MRQSFKQRTQHNQRAGGHPKIYFHYSLQKGFYNPFQYL